MVRVTRGCVHVFSKGSCLGYLHVLKGEVLWCEKGACSCSGVKWGHMQGCHVRVLNAMMFGFSMRSCLSA